MLPGCGGKTDRCAWAQGGGGSCHLAHAYTPCRLPRLWSVAEARSPLMHGPAGTQVLAPLTCTNHSLPESSAPSTAGCPAPAPPSEYLQGG